jgi:uncharacterized protein (TIGR00730 family)
MNELSDRERQLLSPSYRIAALDQDFILGDSQRGLRFQLEYEKAEQSLRAWGVRSTIVVFGSARITENGPGQQADWYRAARTLGSIVSERDGPLQPVGGIRDNVIATGGGPGIMEAANRGASDVGAPTIGFNITLPREQLPNPYTTPDLTFRFHYFAMRKMHLAMRANALVVFPGGFGTFDEMFEIMTLCQTRKMRSVPIVLFDQGFWRRAINFDTLVETGMVNAGDLALFDFAETAEAARTLLRTKLPVTG